RGLLPNLAAVLASSSRGTLYTSDPATTAVAWAGMLTGQTPARHGIYDTECVRPGSRLVAPADHRSLTAEHLWHLLSQAGREILSIHTPIVHSSSGISGLVVGGSDSPNSSAAWHGPDRLVKQLRRELPGFPKHSIWKKRPAATEELALLVRRTEQYFDQLGALVARAGEAVSWSVLAVHLQELDGFLHRMWPELEVDESASELARPEWLGLVRQVLHRLDHFIGTLAGLAQAKGAGLMVVSDHGFTRCRAVVNVNGILRIHGIQRGQGVASRLLSGSRRAASRAENWLGRRLLGTNFGRPIHLAMRCDATRSLAFAPFGRLSGLIYLSEKASGNQSQAERLVDEIAEIFKLIADPETSQPIFSNVITVSKRWGIDTRARGWPEIIAVPADGYHPLARWPGNGLARIQAVDSNLPGTHSKTGIVALSGPGIEPGQPISGHVHDVAPTILKWLGLPEISRAAGRVIGHEAETSIYQPHIRPAHSRVMATPSQATSPVVRVVSVSPHLSSMESLKK
ncbi:MAG: alkaline phosphatase family protein, partial [bacterium]